MANFISKRGEVAANWEDFQFKYLDLCNSNPYDQQTNPMGYVNLGTAMNQLSSDIVNPKLASNEVWSCDTSLLSYKESHGIGRIREAMAKLLTEFFESHEPISADDLYVLTGTTSCLDLLAHCLADPGEVFLIPSPLYSRIYTMLKQRSLVDIWPVNIITEDNDEEYPVLTIEKITSAYKAALAANRVVRGIVLVNPNNPLGDIYPPELLMDIMLFCEKKAIHFIVDELYGLSVFSTNQKFHSAFKFSHIPDPQRIHILYGLSKDFGLAGLRVGIIHTKCEPLKRCLKQLSCFPNVPFPIMGIAGRFLEDLEWCRNYTTLHQQRLALKFDHCVKFLKRIGFKVRDAPAAFFLWVDFRPLCGGSFEEEKAFFTYLIEKAHLFISPGKEFFCVQPGWFRIVFTGNPLHLDEGLSRLERAVKVYKQKGNV